MFVIATSGNSTFLYIIDHFPSSFQNETSCFSVLKLAEQLLFSAHISYGKGKYLNQTGFFYKICQELLFT